VSIYVVLGSDIALALSKLGGKKLRDTPPHSSGGGGAPPSPSRGDDACSIMRY